jgi:hypothetical protein
MTRLIPISRFVAASTEEPLQLLRHSIGAMKLGLLVPQPSQLEI